MLASIEDVLAEKDKQKELIDEIGRRGEIVKIQVELETVILKAPPLTLLLGIPFDILL
jgi:hypothetical protein